MHLLAHILGIDNMNGPIYAFWSGFGSDMSEVTMLGAGWLMLRRHNCHVKGCWRIGRYHLATDHGDFLVCGHHHPTGAIRAADLPKEDSA